MSRFGNLVLSVAIVAVAVALLSGGVGPRGSRSGSLAAGTSASPPATSYRSARFAFLARQTSNSCGLEPVALMGLSSRMRLQGSCCSSMDPAAYRSQVQGLRADVSVSAIPRDPYDIPVSLAKRLLAFDRTVRLSPPADAKLCGCDADVA